ncbi:DUF4760 domain-containing protein [Spirosoma spitsbergense]|uniref:DUF4760 domain-containing protein n=1 Tax=Spirosoma spitsbergense TaxID=431554 RepID=UPI000371B369|nr:hypothetical protein [Spirosoma spitsbergense]
MDLPTHILDIIKTITGCIAIVALIITVKQLKLSRATVLLNSLRGIYEENTKIRKLFADGIKQRNILVSLLENDKLEKSYIYYIYSDEKYNAIREIGYHYEYMGLIIKNKVLPFNVLFSLIQFPDTFWDESGVFVCLMRENYTVDFWENFEYLQKKYKKKRLKKKRRKL